MGDIQKKRCRTTGAEPFGETLPELPFIGDQVVCLGQNQPVWSGPALMSSATCGNEEEAHVQTAIATVSLGGTLNEKLEAITQALFHGVEMFENDLLSFNGTPAETRRMVEDLGLRTITFQPFRDFEG